jgi:hypothetical protein
VDGQSSCNTKVAPRRVPFLVVFVCMLVTLAFIDIDAVGVDWEQSPPYAQGQVTFLHGWPVPFGEHKVRCTWRRGDGDEWECRPPFLNRVNPFMWTPFRMFNVTTAVFDGIAQLLLVGATGVAVLRLQRRRWTRFQFSIAEMFSLTAATSFVLGLIGLGTVARDKGICLPLQAFSYFDQAIVLFAVACAVWLIVLSALNRLGRAKDGADQGSDEDKEAGNGTQQNEGHLRSE